MAVMETSVSERTPDLFILCRGVLWRQWLVLGVTLAGSAAAALAAYSLPPVYKATARILVESQQIPDDLARPTVIASAGERLAMIEQRLLTRDNLLEVSDSLDLFDGQDGLTSSERVRILRESTTVEGIPVQSNPRNRGPSHVSAFTISFRSDDPQRTAQVANAYVDGILQRNRAARSARASETLAFFDSEVARLADELGRAEQDIAAFKARNRAYLPDTVQPRLEELAGLRKQVSIRAARIAHLSGVRVLVEPEPAGLKNSDGGAHADTAVLRTGDVAIGEDPMKQGQIDLLVARQRLTEDRISEVEAAIGHTARVEVELRSMERRYEHLQTMHREAVLKQSDAARGEKLEDSHQVERFEVLEAAQVPEKPIAPKRLSIATGGAMASLALGLLLSAFLEWNSRIVRNGADLQRLLGVRPVLVMPPVQTRRERSGRKKQAFLPLLVFVCVFAVVLWLAGNPGLWSGLLDLIWQNRAQQLDLLAQITRSRLAD